MFKPPTQSADRRLSRLNACAGSCWAIATAILLAAAAATTRAPLAHAITITYDYDERQRPAFDPNGTELRRVADAAIALWSSTILDDRSFHFDLSWEDLDGRLGQHEDFPAADDNIIIDTEDNNGNLRNWFFDPTPFANEEFGGMQQTLVRDLSGAAADAGFSGQPPDVLEVGYRGFANGGTAAAGRIDLLSVLLHELGHELGMNYTFNDDDYDFNPSTVGGASVGAIEQGDYEINLDSVLMTDWPSPGGGERRLPSATDILATWDESAMAVPDGQGGWKTVTFQNYNLPRVDFLGAQSTSWDGTLNWIGGAVPDGDNEVFVRHGGSVVQSATSSSAKSLVVTESSTLLVQGAKLAVIGDTTVGNSFGKRGEIHVGKIGDDVSLQTRNLAIRNGLVNVVPGGILDVANNLEVASQGALAGAGAVLVGGTLRNNGHINGGTFLLFGFGGTLSLVATGGALDLDGDGLETGQISANLGNLEVFGPLADDFNGRASIDATRTMTFFQPWRMAGTLTMRGGADQAHAATLAGAEATIGGRIEVDGHAVVTAPLILYLPAVVSLPDANDTLVLAGTTTMRGGGFTGNGTLAIAGTASSANPFGPALEVALDVRAGGVLSAAVPLRLPKQTTLSGGRITGTASVNQVGDLVVEHNSTIDPVIFLWGVDNPLHQTTVRTGARLDLRPQRITRTASDNSYRGSIRLERGATLNVDLAAADAWTLAGSLELSPGATVRGDDVVNVGRVSGNGQVLVDRFENAGWVAPGRAVGSLQLPGADYVQTPSGVLEIVLGPSQLGSGPSMLRAGTAQLAGTLALSLVSGFRPLPGSEFDVLTASAVSGTFADVELNFPFSSGVVGEVRYHSDRVTFRVGSPSLSADFNDDGAVDGADLALWSEGFGVKVAPNLPQPADATGDARVDGADFLAWQRQVGPAGGLPGRPPALAAVPEPTGGVLMGFIAAALALGRRRRPLTPPSRSEQARNSPDQAWSGL